MFPYNFNICYCIYLELGGINGFDMPDVILSIKLSTYIPVRVTAPVYYFVIVLYWKTAVKLHEVNDH